MSPKTLGKFVFLKRQEEGLSLRELADRLQISLSYISDIEHDRRYPSAAVLARMAKHFRVPPTELKVFDNRIRISDLKRIIDDHPDLRVLFKRMIDEIANGKMTPAELASRLARSL